MSSSAGGGGVRRERDGAMWRCACAVALLCAALARADAEKRAEMSADAGAVPFVMGSRYGRSSPRFISPRNDRFFMGSRYGKRSEIASGGRQEEPDGRRDTPGARSHLKLDRVKQGSAGPVGVAEPTLLCEYTGVRPLYRCVPARQHPRYINRRSGDAVSGPGEQV